MKVMIAGGSGFLGAALARSFSVDGHTVYILTRGSKAAPAGISIHWDAQTTRGWGHLVNEMDVIIHLAGKTLASWPWTSSTRQAFLDSRILPGRALAQAILEAARRPAVFVQQSGINHYGFDGDPADDSTPPGEDFLARLTVEWEAATQSVEELGLRRVVLRSGVVISGDGGMMPLMALPVKLFVGGPLGGGKFAMPWIHIQDWVGAVRHLIEDKTAHGAYNLIAPVPTSSTDFNRTLAQILNRPFWFPLPAFLLRMLFGQMSVLLLEGRFAKPRRLIESGYRFQFEGPHEALADLFG